MPKGRSKESSQRQLRVGEELRHALMQVFERGELYDPAIQNTLITVTEVRISPDLKNATAFFVPLGGSSVDAWQMLEGLRRATPYLRRILSQKVRLRHTPNLSFSADTTFDDVGHIESLLKDPVVARDLAVANNTNEPSDVDNGRS